MSELILRFFTWCWLWYSSKKIYIASHPVLHGLRFLQPLLKKKFWWRHLRLLPSFWVEFLKTCQIENLPLIFFNRKTFSQSFTQILVKSKKKARLKKAWHSFKVTSYTDSCIRWTLRPKYTICRRMQNTPPPPSHLDIHSFYDLHVKIITRRGGQEGEGRMNREKRSCMKSPDDVEIIKYSTNLLFKKKKLYCSKNLDVAT